MIQAPFFLQIEEGEVDDRLPAFKKCFGKADLKKKPSRGVERDEEEEEDSE